MRRSSIVPGREYEFVVRGLLTPEWQTVLNDFKVFPVQEDEKGRSTRLVGRVMDQSALYGVINRLRDLNLDLISLKQIENKEESKGEYHE